jgi:hypothetical protein
LSSLVLDASVALTWCFRSEAAPDTDLLLERIRDDGALVPELWRLELEISTFFESVEQLPIAVERQASARAFGAVFELARSERLSLMTPRISISPCRAVYYLRPRTRTWPRLRGATGSSCSAGMRC